MKLILVSIDEDLHRAWYTYFRNVDDVTFHLGSIIELSADAVVSPANSFGFMDGGIDLLYLRHFGVELQDVVQTAIREERAGRELIVGDAIRVATGNGLIPYLIAAPTMRVPMKLDSNTINPYLAALAVFSISRDDEVIAMPGLGTGVGGVNPDYCASQVRAAYDAVFSPQPAPRSFSETQERHRKLTWSK